MGGTVVVGVVEEEEEAKERSWEERKEEKRWGLGWQGKWGRDGSGGRGEWDGLFLFAGEGRESSHSCCCGASETRVRFVAFFFFLGRRGAFFLCVVVLSASFCVFGLFFFSPPSVHCGPGAVRMCNAEEINRSFLMRKEGYSLFFLLLMIAETTVVYSIRFFFPCPFFCFLSLRKE